MDPSSSSSNEFTSRAKQILSRHPHGSFTGVVSPTRAESSAQALEAARSQRAKSTPRQPAPNDRLRPLGTYRSVEALVSPWVGSSRNLGGPFRSPAGTPRTKWRLALRPSLLGSPQIREMSLEKRAELVCEVAADCMFRLVREVLEPGQGEDWRVPWGVLQSLKRSDLFPRDGPLFSKAEDVIDNLSPSASTEDNRALLERAIRLSNLATFSYIIICPDEAESLLWAYENDPTDSDFPPRRSHRGMSTNTIELASNVARRNAALMKAWKAFWSVLITPEKRMSQEALELWLEFSTQISLTQQCPTIDPPSAPIDDLPPAAQPTARLVLADDAVQSHGELEQPYSESEAESIRDMESHLIEKKWVRLASARRTELEQVSSAELMERYAYIAFAQDIAVYVQAQLSGLDVQLVRWGSTHFPSPGRLPSTLHPHVSPSRLGRSSTGPAHSLGFRSPQNPSTKSPRVPPDRETEYHHTAAQPGSLPHVQASPSIREQIDEMPIDMGLLSSMVGDLDAEFQSSRPSTPTQVGGSPHSLRHTQSSRASRSRRVADEDDEWPVKEAIGPIASPSTSKRSKRFNFSARQEDAHRIEWDSQSPAHPGPSLPAPRDSLTPRANHKIRHSANGHQTQLVQERTAGLERQESHHVTFHPEDIVPSDSQLGSRPRTPGQDLDFDEDDLLPSASQMHTQANAFNDHDEDELDPDDIMPSESQLGTPLPIHRDELDLEVNDVLPSQSQMETQARGGWDRHTELDPDDIVLTDSQLGTPAPEVEDDAIGIDDIVPSASQLDTQAGKHRRRNEDSLELDVDVVLLSASQLDPILQNEDEAEIDLEDVLPSESQLGPPKGRQLVNSAIEGQTALAMDDGVVDMPLPEGQFPTRIKSPIPPMVSPQLPTSQHRLHSSRMERIGDALEFEETRADEDEEDRLLLRRDMPNDNDILMDNGVDVGGGGDVDNGDFGAYGDLPGPETDFQHDSYDQDDIGNTDDVDNRSRQSSVEDRRQPRSSNLLGVFDEGDHNLDERDNRRVSPSKLAGRRRPPSPRRAPRAVEVLIPARRTPFARAPTNDFWPDPHMIDEDGSPLDTDPTLVLPQGYKFEPSRIHGRKDGQLSSYSRLAGGLRWTKDQELLLYRTIQKVPLVESYPTKVMWYLHGEYGIFSRQLEQFNPQHMKDKMRTIVETRVRNNRPVVGRARHWLSKTHPDKKAFDEEVKEFWYEQRGLPPNADNVRAGRFMGERQERPKRKKSQRKKSKKKKDVEEDETEVDDLESEGDVDVAANAGEDRDPMDPEDQENGVGNGEAAEEDDDEGEFEAPGPKRGRRSPPVLSTPPASMRKSGRRSTPRNPGRAGKVTRKSKSAPGPLPPATSPSPRGSPPASRTRARKDNAPGPSPRASQDMNNAPRRQLRSSVASKTLADGRTGSGSNSKDYPAKSKGRRGPSKATKRDIRRKSQRSIARDERTGTADEIDEGYDQNDRKSEGEDDAYAVETQAASENVRRAMIRRKVYDQAA